MLRSLNANICSPQFALLYHLKLPYIRGLLCSNSFGAIRDLLLPYLQNSLTRCSLPPLICTQIALKTDSLEIIIKELGYKC